MSRLCVPFFLGMRQPYVRTVFRVRDPLSVAKSTLKKLYDFLREPSRNPGAGCWPEPGAAEGPTNNERLPLAFPFRLPEHREAVAPYVGINLWLITQNDGLINLLINSSATSQKMVG